VAYEEGNNSTQMSSVSQNSQFQDESILKIKLDPSRITTNLAKYLGGYEWVATEEGGAYQKVRPGMLNDDGVDYIMTVITPLISNIIMLGNLSDETIRKETWAICSEVASTLAIKNEYFGADESYLGTIVKIVKSAILSTFSRSEGGFEQTNMRENIRSVETRSINQGQAQGQKKNLWGSLAGR
jgi:hypothetical protein